MWEFLGFESERAGSVCWPNNKIIDWSTTICYDLVDEVVVEGHPFLVDSSAQGASCSSNAKKKHVVRHTTQQQSRWSLCVRGSSLDTNSVCTHLAGSWSRQLRTGRHPCSCPWGASRPPANWSDSIYQSLAHTTNKYISLDSEMSKWPIRSELIIRSIPSNHLVSMVEVIRYIASIIVLDFTWQPLADVRHVSYSVSVYDHFQQLIFRHKDY